MALITCRQCGGKMSEHAQKCPHCGAPKMVRDTIPQRNNDRRIINSDKRKSNSGTNRWALWVSLSAVLFVFLCVGTYFLLKAGKPDTADENTSSITETRQETDDSFRDGYYEDIPGNAAVAVEAVAIPAEADGATNPAMDGDEKESVKASSSLATGQIRFKGRICNPVGVILQLPDNYHIGQAANVNGEYWYGSGANGTLVLSGSVSSSGRMMLREYTHEGSETGSWDVYLKNGPDGLYIEGYMTNSKGDRYDVRCYQDK